MPIQIHAPRVTVDLPDVYYAFPSGSLRYDCQQCGSHCCRGFGFVSTLQGALQEELRKRPTLSLFLTPELPRQNNPHVSVGNCAPGCFFLDAGGGCHIHREYGRSSKPETCQHFPFNFFYLVGRTLVVAPHPDLCPLTIDMTRGSEESQHQALWDSLQDVGISKIAAVTPHVDGSTGLIARERAALDAVNCHWAAADWDGYLSAVGGDDRLPTWIPTLRSVFEEATGVVVDQTALGNRNLRSLMLAAAPSLRMSWIRNDLSKPGTGRPTRLANRLVLLHWLAAAAHQAGVTVPTFQTLSALKARHAPLLEFISWSGEDVGLSRSMVLNLSSDPRDREAVLLSCLRSLLTSPGREFISHVIQTLRGCDEKMAALQLLSERVGPHLRYRGCAESIGVGQRTRTAVQRWAIRYSGLATLADSRSH